MDKFEMNKEQKPIIDPRQSSKRPNEFGSFAIQGHVKIHDPVSKEIFVNKRNAIHYENFSFALAQSIGNQQVGFISEMSFGNGGSRVDPTGIITYLTPNTSGINAELYNKTYTKVIDANSAVNKDPSRNFMEPRHVTGTYYTDLLVTCLLDFGEPNDQSAFDNSTDQNSSYVFDELGLRAYSLDGMGMGRLLTHVIFHPVQKSLNRMIQIDYTVRIQSLTNGM